MEESQKNDVLADAEALQGEGVISHTLVAIG